MAVREHADVDVTRVSALIAFDRSTLGNVVERLEARVGWSAARVNRIGVSSCCGSRPPAAGC